MGIANIVPAPPHFLSLSAILFPRVSLSKIINVSCHCAILSFYPLFILHFVFVVVLLLHRFPHLSVGGRHRCWSQVLFLKTLCLHAQLECPIKKVQYSKAMFTLQGVNLIFFFSVT